MLILSRNKSESIIIGKEGPDQIQITVIDIKGGRTRLGIKAPAYIPVHRQEVYHSIKKKGQQHGRKMDRD